MPMKLMKQNKGWRPLGRLFASSIFGLIPYLHRYWTYLYYYIIFMTHDNLFLGHGSRSRVQMTCRAENFSPTYTVDLS